MMQEARTHFEVGWGGPVVVGEGESACVASLRLLSVGTDARLSTFLTIHTNITTIKIPLIAYNGKLTKYIPPMGESWLDFGTLGMGDERDLYFFVINENPVELRLSGWGSNLTRSVVELMGVEEGNITSIRSRSNITYSQKSLFLRPNHYAAFRIGIVTPDTEGIFVAESHVQTQYEQIKIPFRLRTADGSLSVVPSTIVFHNSFPGKISHQNLHILSTFGHSMTVSEVKPLPGDLRFSYESSRPVPATLQPGHKSHIGRLIFDPKLDCGTECYTGFTLSGKGGQQWVNTLSLTSHVADTDTSLYSTLRGRYLNLSTILFNTSVVLHTSEVHGFHFNVQASLKWPSLCSLSHLTFPLTQVLNTSVQEVFIENPATVPIVAQILLLHHYPAPQHILSMLHQQLAKDHTVLGEDGATGGLSGGDVFTIIDMDSASGGGAGGGSTRSPHMPPPVPEITSGFAQHRRTLEELFKTRVAKDSIAITLEPGMKVKVRLSFTPPDERTHTTVLLVRNNLTVVDAVLVQGRGGRGFLKFGNRKPGSSLPLAFNIGAKHLKDCEGVRSSRFYQPNFTVKRSFVARNTGELPVHVWGFWVNEAQCEGYGFKVLDCRGFHLAPNTSHKVDIAFTPDFTLAKVQQRLVIHTSLESGQSGPSGQVEYSLVATVPAQLLAQCGAAVPRPGWEGPLYYGVVLLMVVMLAGAVVLALLEADHILKVTVIAMTTSLPANGHIPAFDKSKVFDLHAIAHSESRTTGLRNGYANGHTVQDRSRKSQAMGEIVANGRKTNARKSQSQTTKTRYTRPAETKTNTVDTDQAKSKKGSYANPNTSTKANQRNVESLSWTRFFQRAVGKGESAVSEGREGARRCSPTTTTARDDPGVQRQSVATETDIQLVEAIQRVRRRPRPAPQHHEEETSSTTTESSNTDELSLEAGGSSSSSSRMTEPAVSSGSVGGNTRSAKKRNSKTKAGKVNVRSANDDSATNTFEGNNKAKSGKKGRTETRSGGGDAITPDTLDLTYAVKPVRVEREKEQQHTRPSLNQPSPSGRSSPNSPATWEDSRHVPQEQEHSNPPVFSPKVPQTQPQPLAPRESSYSAILLGTDKHKNKNTPFAKVNPEVKRVEKTLGVIGQKAPTPHPTLASLRGLSTPGVTMGASVPLLPTPDHHPTQPFPPHPLKEDYTHPHTHTRNIYSPGHVDSPSPPSIHSWDPKTLNAPPALRPPPGLPQQGHEPQHRHPAMQGEEEWPRYEHSMTLWQEGTPPSPTPSVAVAAGGPGGGGGGNGYPHHHPHHPPPQHHHPDSPSTAPAPSLWDSLSNIWSPPFWGSEQQPQLQHHQQQQQQQQSPWNSAMHHQSAANDASGAVSKGLGFDPFHSVTNIWTSPPTHPADLWPPPSAKKDV